VLGDLVASSVCRGVRGRVRCSRLALCS
jgi:hypothetical protein